MATYYVRTTGDDTTGDGSTGTPWKTVSKAILTVSLAGGHTINVGDGTYAESTSGLHYLYCNRTFAAEVIIQAENGIAANVILQGETSTTFCLRFGGAAAYYTFKNISVLAQNATVTSAAKSQDAGADHIKFSGCVLSVEANNGYCGIWSTITNPTFDGCTFQQTGANIVTGLLFQNTTTNLVINNCTSSLTGQGVVLTAANTNTTITNCNFYTSGSGICGQFDRCTNLTITNCDWHSVGATGVALRVGSDGAGNANTNIVITGGTCISDASHGLLIGGNTDGFRVSGVRVQGSNQGIVLKNASNGLVENCVSSHSGGQGLYGKGATNCTFSNCIDYALGGYGIGIENSGALLSTGCSWSHVTIYASGSAGCLLCSTSGLGAGNIVDYNIYYPNGTARLGTVRANSSIPTLDSVRVAWSGYGYGNNDRHSRDATQPTTMRASSLQATEMRQT